MPNKYGKRGLTGKHGHQRTGRRVTYKIIICQNCKGSIELSPGTFKARKTVLYCSQNCFSEVLRKKNREKWSEEKCQKCGNKFKKLKSRFTKFCSKNCSIFFRKGVPLTEVQKNKVKLAMARPEIKNKLRILNARPRSPQTLDHINKRKLSRGVWTIEQRRAVSNKLKGKLPANMVNNASNYSNIKSGHYLIDGKDFFFRSRWEANYALYLNFLIKTGEILKWEYESEVFIFEAIKFGTRSYRPDFKVWNKKGAIEFHEVKGYMDKKSLTKLSRMKKYFPKIKIILIEKESYMDIKNKVGKLLKFY